MYHVINRGNYRSWIFEDDASKAAFEKCLFEACEEYGWILHAYCVMGNHFQLGPGDAGRQSECRHALAAGHVRDALQPLPQGEWPFVPGPL